MNIIKRIFRAGGQGFYRNRTVSLSSIFILTITLSVMMALGFAHYVFSYTLDSIKDKVDIRVYMKPDTNDEDISATIDNIKSLSNVKSALLESKADALSKYKEQHKNDKDTLTALEDIGVNPFGSSISVSAVDPVYYNDIVKNIKKYANDKMITTGNSPIERISYDELKDNIEKINNIISWVDKIGLWISIIFVSMSLMIVYNTTRLAIYVFREEINIMKLVGASNMFIRGPFIVEAVMYAIIATIITFVIYYPFAIWATGKSIVFLQGLSMIDYYQTNFWSLALIFVCISISITVTSSFFAVRKYLKM